jgi:hypothetical protein
MTDELLYRQLAQQQRLIEELADAVAHLDEANSLLHTQRRDTMAMFALLLATMRYLLPPETPPQILAMVDAIDARVKEIEADRVAALLDGDGETGLAVLTQTIRAGAGPMMH